MLYSSGSIKGIEYNGLFDRKGKRRVEFGTAVFWATFYVRLGKYFEVLDDSGAHDTQRLTTIS